MPPKDKKHASHEAALKDERRAFEHRARVHALHASLEKKAAHDLKPLLDLAHQQLEAGRTKAAADLLRAAEHLSFAALHTPEAAAKPHPKLADELTHEFEHKLRKADELWSEEDEHPEPLEPLYTAAVDHASKAHKGPQLRRGPRLRPRRRSPRPRRPHPRSRFRRRTHPLT